MSFFVKKYRNIYIRCDTFPYHKLTGRDVLAYTGEIIKNTSENSPEGYDESKDYFFSCDCMYPKWGRIEKI